MRIARRKHTVTRHHHDGESAIHLTERIGNGVDQRVLTRVRNELHNDFRIARRLEERSSALELGTQITQIHQITVVRNGNKALSRLHADWLRIQQRRVARSRVARMADSHIALELGQYIVGEDIGNQPHALDVRKISAVGSSDTSRLLPTMLQGIESKIGLSRSIRMTVNSNNTALFAKLVIGAARTAGRGFAANRLRHLRCFAGNAFDQQVLHAHAVTSSWSMASKAWDQDSLRSTTEVLISSSLSTEIWIFPAMVSPSRVINVKSNSSAICLIWSTTSGEQLTITCEANSPNKAVVIGAPGIACTDALTPMSFSNAPSARATA